MATTNFVFGLNLVSDAIKAISGEEHFVNIDYQGVVSSGDAMVGLNIAVTPIGANANWVAGIYSKVVYGAGLVSQGYIDAAEFEIVSTNANPCYCYALGLNFNSAVTDIHSAFIAIRDYGADPCNSLLYLGEEIVKGNDADTTSLFAATTGPTANATLRFMHGNTPLWILCATAQT